MSEIRCEAGKWKLIEEEATLPDGRVAKKVIAHRPDSVHIIAHTSPQSILLLREYRPFLAEWVWMLPSGWMEEGEKPEAAALRELREETKKGAKELRSWISCRYAESIQSIQHIFIATDLYDAPLQGDPEELIEVHEVPLVQAVTDVLNDKYAQHTITAYALLRYGIEKGIAPKSGA
ncbi:MAG TPA: NUDIX hydrolase [Candidatus Peribacterales bacterium]|nr:NUDIX hydrolase [Candidatus Peribacterales bacterium]